MRTASWTARTVKLPTRTNRASTIWAAKRRCGRLSVSLPHEIHGFPGRKCRNSVTGVSNYGPGEGGFDVADQIVPGFASRAETNEAFTDGVRSPPRAPLGHRVHAAKAGGFTHEPERSEE